MVMAACCSNLELEEWELETNLALAGTFDALTDDHVASLSLAGISQVAYGVGLNTQALAVDDVLIRVASGWNNDGGDPYSFDGIPVHGANSWVSGFGDEAPGIVVALFIAPTTNWEGGNGGAGDWTKGNVQLGIDLVGSCPIATEGIDGEPDYAYYMAMFKVYNDWTIPAKLIGFSCPEDGIINP